MLAACGTTTRHARCLSHSDICVSVILSSTLLVISLLHYLSGPTGVSALNNMKWVALGAVAIGLPSIAYKAFIALKNRVGSCLLTYPDIFCKPRVVLRIPLLQHGARHSLAVMRNHCCRVKVLGASYRPVNKWTSQRLLRS